MLHYEAIEPKTLELLNSLMKEETFQHLRLVRGTALALQIGHRLSVDLDLFGTIHSDEFEINNILGKNGPVKILNKTKNILIYLVNGIKLDLVNYPYPWLEKEISKDNLRLAGLKDIAAMKLSAITGRGTKKDFIDIFFLFKFFPLATMLDFYHEKYPDGSELLVLKSLTYFKDAEAETPPKMLHPIDWGEVKKRILKEVEGFVDLKSQT